MSAVGTLDRDVPGDIDRMNPHLDYTLVTRLDGFEESSFAQVYLRPWKRPDSKDLCITSRIGFHRTGVPRFVKSSKILG